MRKNSYKEKPSHEQAECIRRMETEPDYRYRELLVSLKSLAADFPALSISGVLPKDGQSLGTVVAEWREYRGL